ncbi:MAG TPA: metal-dependent hydrolase [Pyrinomonadaceae bacterium]|jgi:inner membrane protein|nr:metal-dependent hydrolase [Pyrinomonadaceae bacterium]
MDNLTHSLVGLVAAKAGLERLSPMATTVCVLAANAPDLDILATLGGKWFYLHNHRGITHSIAGTLALALLIPALFYAGDLILARIRKREPRVKFRGLLIASLILSASHPLMDWTNNYGVRPLLPWNRQWFYGDLVFIVDPWLWLALGGAAFLLASKRLWQTSLWAVLALALTGFVLFLPLQNAGLLHTNIFRVLWIAVILGLIVVHRTELVRRWGSSIATLALALVIVYWGGLAVAHRAALSQAQTIAQQLSTQNGETLNRIAAMPTLADPFRWQCVADTDRSVYRFFISLTGNDGSTSELKRFEKPQGKEAEAVARASQDERARIFLDFARFPAASVDGDCLSGLLVQFADLRYTEPSASQRGTFSLNVPVACETETGNKK